MKALGGFMISTVGKIFDKTNPDGLSAIQSNSFADAVASDVANDETSYAGALSGTAMIITGWITAIMLLLGFVLGMKQPMKKRTVRRRRKAATRRTTRKRTYRRKK